MVATWLGAYFLAGAFLAGAGAFLAGAAAFLGSGFLLVLAGSEEANQPFFGAGFSTLAAATIRAPNPVEDPCTCSSKWERKKRVR